MRISDVPPCSSQASQMLRITRRRFNLTTGFFAFSFWAVRENRSGCARVDATGGERRSNFCNGSRKFSKASGDTSGLVKQDTRAVLKELESKNCSTFAVSSWSL